MSVIAREVPKLQLALHCDCPIVRVHGTSDFARIEEMASVTFLTRHCGLTENSHSIVNR